MKKEFGKWLMDVAKYMVTALLLSTIFADLNEPIIIYIVVILSIVVLLIGLLLVSDVHLYEDKSITNNHQSIIAFALLVVFYQSFYGSFQYLPHLISFFHYSLTELLLIVPSNTTYGLNR